MTDTPDGFYRPSGLKYPEEFVATEYAYVLNSSGRSIARVDETFDEIVTGSHTWYTYITNEWSYGAAFESSFDYYCGVNIPGSDPTCDTWVGNSGATHSRTGVHFGTWSTSTDQGTVDASSGIRNGTKFPMLRDKIAWSSLGSLAKNMDDHGHWGWPVRGYDVCGSSLCGDSGDGS